MAAFTDDELKAPRLDWRLLRDGFVALYHRRDVLDPDVAWLREHAYDVKELDASAWTTVDAMYAALARALAFPDYFGANLNALNDCLSEIDVASPGGLALVLPRFDVFARAHPATAQGLLDVVADNARRFLLVGCRMITLVQSDDPAIVLDAVGATPVIWNPREWSNASRGV